MQSWWWWREEQSYSCVDGRRSRVTVVLMEGGAVMAVVEGGAELQW